MSIKSGLAAGLIASIVSTGAVFAQSTITDKMIAELKSQGYTQFQVGRTFFGRIRIDAVSPNSAREVIMNRYTGEILRDADMTSRLDEMKAMMPSQPNSSDMGQPGMGGAGNSGPGGMGSAGGAGGMGGAGGAGGGMGGAGGGAGGAGGMGG